MQIFAGWLSVSFGNIESSLDEPEVNGVLWSRICSGREASPSTKKRESMFELGRASGASVSNKILSDDT